MEAPLTKTQIILVRVLIALYSILTVIQTYRTSGLTDTIEEVQKQNIILQDSLFNTNVELGRYQMTLELLKEGKDKGVAEKFEYILNTQTE